MYKTQELYQPPHGTFGKKTITSFNIYSKTPLTYSLTCAFKTLSVNRCVLDRLERSEKPDAVWMVWSLPRNLHPVANWRAFTCHQPPGRLCPDQRKGNTHDCHNAKGKHKTMLMNAMIIPVVPSLSSVDGMHRMESGLTTCVRRHMDTSVRRRRPPHQLKAPTRQPIQDASL